MLIKTNDGIRSRALILTTMNEAEGLHAIWDQIPFYLFTRVVVVDGSSTDGTLEFLADKRCELFSQKSPGRGNAIREAMDRITEKVVVLMASDGNDNPTYIPHLLSKLEEGYDLVSGSRFAKGGESDDSDDPVRIRKLGNRLFTMLVNFFWNGHLTDAAYGLRAFRTEAWRQMRVKVAKNETEFLMSIRGAKLRLRTCQIPVVEGTRRGGKVKAKTVLNRLFATQTACLRDYSRE